MVACVSIVEVDFDVTVEVRGDAVVELDGIVMPTGFSAEFPEGVLVVFTFALRMYLE